METDKKTLRKKFIQIRKNVADRQQKDRQIFKLFAHSDLYRNAQKIMFYISMSQEPDTKQMITTALAEGKRVFVPKVIDKTHMKACEIKGGEDYEKSSLGVYEPKVVDFADPEELDLIIVPGMAFDKKGTRLGYGGGFYDRFLVGISCNTVGLCYHDSLTDSLIKDEKDINVKYIITEKGIICCGG